MAAQSCEDVGSAAFADTPLSQWATQPLALWMQTCVRMQAESIRFIGHRLAKDLSAAGRLAACRTPLDALEAGVGLAADATRDYLDEGQRLLAVAAGDFESVLATTL